MDKAYEIILLNTMGCAYFDTTDELISDVASAAQLFSTVKYESNINRIALRREAVCADFFDLSNGMAPAILIKFAPKHYKFGLVGDFSDLEGTKFGRFIERCNGGDDMFFGSDKDAILKRLANATS